MSLKQEQKNLMYSQIKLFYMKISLNQNSEVNKLWVEIIQLYW